MAYSQAENDIIQDQALSNSIPCCYFIQNVIQTVYVFWGKTVKIGHHFYAISHGAVPCNSKGILKYSFFMTDFSLLNTVSLPLFAIKAFF